MSSTVFALNQRVADWFLRHQRKALTKKRTMRNDHAGLVTRHGLE
jgi:hypothetical protein